jgi:enterochelin esterase family protein
MPPLRALGLALLALGLAAAAAAQPRLRTLPEARAALADAARTGTLDALWVALVRDGDVPLVRGDSALFLWRGEAASVAIAGDHTGWRPDRAPLRRLPGTDLWLRADAFPPTARTDYKVVVDGADWRLDDANPRVQFSGMGPNSELRMPGWREAPETRADPLIPAGTLAPPDTLHSAALGAPLVYRVYTPHGADTLPGLPTIYVTDGHEYADPRLGALTVVLDHLVADGRVEPARVVFIDPRWDGENRRQALYVGTPAFADAVATELVPAIDARFRTRADRDGRVILGTSFGGVFAATLGLRHPDVFARLAIQSPAFWITDTPAWREAFGEPPAARFAALPPGRFVVSLSTGTYFDGQELTRAVLASVAAGGQPLTYREVPEGHSWGAWRALLPRMLTDLLDPVPQP